MSRLLVLVRGFSGHPLHPPLTDVAIGAYTVGVVMLVLGAAGVEEEQMAHGALLAVGGGLAVTLPTALTGMIDWLEIPRGTPAWTAATIHLVTMVAATVLFVVTFVQQLEGYREDQVVTGAWIPGVLGELLLVAGGYVGGALVFVYGVRVVGRGEAPFSEALVPGRAEEAAERTAGEQAGEMAPDRGA